MKQIILKSKTLMTFIVVLAMTLSAVGVWQTRGTSQNIGIADTIPIPVGGWGFQNRQEFRQIDGYQLLAEMGMGWNFGNLFEANTGQMPNESAWGSPMATRGMIRRVQELGFNSIRLPITWGRMIRYDYNGSGGYCINPLWINRIHDVVDYAISAGLYVTINMHHDGAENGGWFALGNPVADLPDGERSVWNQTATWEERLSMFTGAWTYIANHFSDFGERLIFAGMNEIRGGELWQNLPGNTAQRQAAEDARVSEANQAFVDAVRRTGGNNAMRWLVVAPYYATPERLQGDNWLFPTDEYRCETVHSNRIKVAIHHYTWFPTANTYGDGVRRMQIQRNTVIRKAADRGVTEFVPMVLGEFGFVHDFAGHNHTGIFDTGASGVPQDWGNRSRVRDFEITARGARVYGLVPFVWDTPGQMPSSLFDRTQRMGLPYGPSNGTTAVGDSGPAIQPQYRTFTHRAWRAMLRATMNPLPENLIASNTGTNVIPIAEFFATVRDNAPSGGNNATAHTVARARGFIPTLTNERFSAAQAAYSFREDDFIASMEVGGFSVNPDAPGATQNAMQSNPMTITMRVGETLTLPVLNVFPVDTLDVINWVALDENIAVGRSLAINRSTEIPTGRAAMITATGIGRTTVIGYNQGHGGLTNANSEATIGLAGAGTARRRLVHVIVLPQTRSVDSITDISLPQYVAGSYEIASDHYGNNPGVLNTTAVFVTKGNVVNLTPILTPANTSDSVTFSSSDNSVAAVSLAGRVRAVEIGIAYVTITAISGFSRTFKIVVETPGKASRIELALNVMFADDRAANANVRGETVYVEYAHFSDLAFGAMGYAQYTFTFCIERDLPSELYEALNTPRSGGGAHGFRTPAQLDRLVSVYIRDVAVSEGRATISPLDYARIRYDEIVLGNRSGDTMNMYMRSYDCIMHPAVPRTSTMGTYENGYFVLPAGWGSIERDDETGRIWQMPIRDNGVFDTNGPINGWDGSIAGGGPLTLVDGRTAQKHNIGPAVDNPQVRFLGISNPSTIEVTLTISRADFTEEFFVPTDSTDISYVDSDTITLDEVGDTAILEVVPSPSTTTSSISFDSSDANVVMVDGNMIGSNTMRITAVGNGVATVTARTNNGLLQEFDITVGDGIPPEIGANKAALRNLINSALTRRQDNYTTATWTVFETALTAAIVVRDNLVATQTQVDGAYSGLLSAMTALTTGVNRVILQTAISTAQGLNKANFTPESWETLAPAIAAAIAVRDNQTATQAQIDDAVIALNAVVNALVSTGIVDRATLIAVIELAEQRDRSRYTTESWVLFDSALAHAITVRDNANATQTEIEATLLDLNTRMDNLVIVGGVSRVAINIAIETASARVQATYTEATWETFVAARTEAITVRDNVVATQVQIDAALLALNTAMDALAPVTAPTVDRAALNAAITAANARVQANYTEATWETFVTARSAAIAVRDNADAT
ncbi:MAG: cellulase family glycosylhydrolase, partial [Firmicutes bacterium]|nr:cellulase family glycosylhydrolase [Bacillota bacterium]